MGFPLEEAPLTIDGNRSVRVGQVSKQHFKMGQTTRDPTECGERFSSSFDANFHLPFFFFFGHKICYFISEQHPRPPHNGQQLSCRERIVPLTAT